MISFFMVFLQDIKTRTVQLYLFPLITILGSVLFFLKTNTEIFVWFIGYNLVLTSLVMLCLYAYSAIILKKSFLKEAFGLGDLLLCYGLCFLFPTYTFIILLAFSILLSLVFHLIFKRKSAFQTVPLAGYMSLFFALVFASNALSGYPNLYLF
ncbi:hypothetical protein ACJD0Z_04250 [Flavobacteriaceae bacterium M23B6Z8]